MTENQFPHGLPPGTHVWIYVRYSPGDNQSAESQSNSLIKYAEENQWIVDRIYIDRGQSGSTDNRAQFQLMLHNAKIKPRLADAILIWDTTRFGRNQTENPYNRSILRQAGFRIISVSDNIPVDDPIKFIVEAVKDYSGASYLTQLKKSTVRGLKYIADQGCVPTGTIAIGYTAEEVPIGARQDGSVRYGRRPKIDPDIAPVIVKAFEMKARGASNKVIAKETALFSPKSGSWKSFFTNKIYIGEFQFMGTCYPNIYPRIISDQLFDSAGSNIPTPQKRMKGKHHPRRKSSTFILANICYCAYCSSPMEGKRVKKYRYYVCSKHNESADLCPDSGLIPADEVEEQLMQLLSETILDTKYLNRLLDWSKEYSSNEFKATYLQTRS